jgi:hypothetical protein
MRVSDHRLGDNDLGTGDRLPFLRPDKIKAVFRDARAGKKVF